MADAVELAVDRSRGNRRWLLQFPVFVQKLLRFGLVVRVEHLVEIGDLGGSALRIVERAAERNDLSHRVGKMLGQLAGVDSAEALAHDTDATFIFFMELHQQFAGTNEQVMPCAEIDALLPAARKIAERRKKIS